MAERLRSGDGNERVSRRKLLKLGGGVAALAFVTGAGNRLQEGVTLRSQHLRLQPFSVHRAAEYTLLTWEYGSEDEREWCTSFSNDGRLIFEPADGFFTEDRDLHYVHRTNDLAAIHEAYAMRANVFDIDANDVLGEVYAEHGIIPQPGINMGGMQVRIHIPMVYDQNEGELKLGMPNYTYEDLIECIHTLSTPENPLAASTELKRGKFDRDTLNKMLTIHQKYDVPVIIKSENALLLEAIRTTFA